MSRFIVVCTAILLSVMGSALSGQGNSVGNRMDGKRLFELETFGGNGRTCVTCHSLQTGTVSPQDALRRFQADPGDALFTHDGSDDGQGHGVTRMLSDATVLITIPLASNLHVAGNPAAASVVLRRGIPTTLDTPALPLPEPLHPQDNIFMLDGRQRTLELQAAGAIHDHAVATVAPSSKDLQRIKEFQLTDDFFTSGEMRSFARGGPAPGLPEGRTAQEKRGRFFFEDVVDFVDFNHGLCGACHSGPLLNQTNFFFQLLTNGAVPQGSRFQDVLVSELNEGGNPVIQLLLNTGSTQTPLPPTPDPGRFLITGNPVDFNAFKIPNLRGLSKTAPYFHDNSAKTLADVVKHYKTFFEIVTDPDGPLGPAPPAVSLSQEDMDAIVAFMKLL
jgi:cytochrome c peroxidase